MLDMRQIIEAVGRRRYEDARAEAWKIAPQTGKCRQREASDELVSDVAHDVSIEIWDAESDPSSKLGTVFQFYDELPSYAFLFYIEVHFDELSEAAKELMWGQYRKYLSERFGGWGTGD